MRITRRQFLLATGAMGGLTLLQPNWEAANEISSVSGPATSGNVSWTPSICNFCSSFCDIKVAVRDTGGIKRAVKIEGNPNSPLNRGKICARGQAGLGQLYDPDRLKEPLIRVEGSKRGEWNFRTATWDEAYEYIATKLKGVNPWEIVLAGGWTACVSYGQFCGMFVKTLNTPNFIASPFQHCVTAGHLGTDMVTGNFNVHDEMLADFENARYILLALNNASVGGISTPRAARFGKAKKKGARVVCLDPRMSETAAKADEWLPIKPGTDMAFFLAMIHTILRDELYEKDVLSEHTNAPFLTYKDDNGIVQLAADLNKKGKPTAFYIYDEVSGKIVATPPFTNSNNFTLNGKRCIPALHAPGDLIWNSHEVKTVFECFVEESEQYTPEWASALTDIPAETIERIAVEFGQARPALVDPGWAGARYQHLIPLRRLQAILQTLVGGIDRPGGWLMGGEYRHKAEAYYKWTQQDPATRGKPTLAGMALAEASVAKFATPGNWKYGKPALSFAWSAEQQAKGEIGVMMPFKADTGILEAVKGEFSYQGEPYNIKAFILNATNPVHHYYPEGRWAEIFKHDNVDLVMAIDVLPSDSTVYADVILPNHTYLERNEPLIYPLGADTTLSFATRYPAIDPLYNTRATVDIFFGILGKMGLVDKYIKKMAKLFHFDHDSLKKELHAAIENDTSVTDVIAEFALDSMAHHAEQMSGQKMTVEELDKTLREDGLVTFKSAEDLLEEAGIPWKIPAPSSSGRLELYSPLSASFIEKVGYQPNWDPILTYMPPVLRDGDDQDKPLAQDEFYFIWGKVPVVSHASTNTNNPLLAAVTKPKEGAFLGLWMNTKTAAKLGLSDGEEVEVENLRYGPKANARLFVTEMIRPDTVFLPSAYGSRNPKLSVASGKGTALNSLLNYSIEPIVASLMSQEFTVRIRPVQKGVV